MLSQKEVAELRREKGELEAKRLELKEKCKNHRDMTTEELNETADQLRAMSDRLDEINTELKNAPEPKNRGGLFEVKNTEITSENYRSSVQYRDAFYRSFLNGKVADTDADIMSFGKRAVTDLNGGSVASGAEYLVPQTTLDMVMTVITQYGKVYSAVTKYGFTGDVTIPIGVAGAPTDNADGTTTLNFTFTEVEINQQAVVATITVKNLLLRNSIPAFEQYLAYELGKYIGLQLENLVLNGSTINSKFQGIITAIKADPSAAQTYSIMDWAKIAEILGAVESPYGDNGTFVMKRSTFFNKIFSIVDGNGAPLVTTTLVKGGPGQSNFLIAGMPVIFTSQMPAGDTDPVLFGDLSTFIVNESEAFGIEANTSEKFSSDQTVWRGKVYSGGKPLYAKNTFAYYSYSAT